MYHPYSFASYLYGSSWLVSFMIFLANFYFFKTFYVQFLIHSPGNPHKSFYGLCINFSIKQGGFLLLILQTTAQPQSESSSIPGAHNGLLQHANLFLFLSFFS